MWFTEYLSYIRAGSCNVPVAPDVRAYLRLQFKWRTRRICGTLTTLSPLPRLAGEDKVS